MSTVFCLPSSTRDYSFWRRRLFHCCFWREPAVIRTHICKEKQHIAAVCIPGIFFVLIIKFPCIGQTRRWAAVHTASSEPWLQLRRYSSLWGSITHTGSAAHLVAAYTYQRVLRSRDVFTRNPECPNSAQCAGGSNSLRHLQ